MKGLFVFAALLGFVAAQDTTQPVQTLCPGGYYSREIFCIPCEPGQYTLDVTAYRPSCTDCPVGTISTAQMAVSCTSCPEGFTTSGPGASSCIQLTQCPPGQEPEGTGCVSCSAGQYQGTTGRAGCQLCPAGQFQPLAGQASCNICATSTSAGSTTCTSCTAGQRLDGTACVACAAGTYQPNSGFSTTCLECATALNPGSSTCPAPANCAPGKYPVDNICTNCLAGTYQPSQGGTACLPCPAGTSSPNQATTQCSSCGAGTFQDLTGQANCKPCTGDFTSNIGATSCTIPLCDAGSQPEPSGCALCPVGSYSEARDTLNCTDCSAGLSTAGEGSTSSAACRAVCGPGENANENNTCVPCSVAFYKSTRDVTGCLFCGTGRSTVGEGSTSADQCSLICPLGEEDNGNDACRDCARNSYKAAGPGSCAPCPNGTITLNVGAGAESLCVAKCAAGTYRDTRDSSCTACALGFYQSMMEQSECTSCGDGRTTRTTGSSEEEQCVPVCTPGNYLDTDNRCKACAEGTFQSQGGATSCTPCVGSLTTRQEGSTSVDQCVARCGPGTFETAIGCDPCPYGRYQPDPEQGSCVLCDEGTITRELGATDKSQCKPICGPGNYLVVEQCIPCGISFYQDQQEQTECKACDPRLTTRQEGSARAEDCIFLCPAGNTQSGETCTPCALGSYQPIRGLSQCRTCEDNKTTYEAGAIFQSQCLPICPAGSALTGSTCSLCGKGYYQPLTGQRRCLACPDGKSTDERGSDEVADCIDVCRPGTYHNGTHCANCAVGSYQPGEAAKSCLPCPGELTTLQDGATASGDCQLDCAAGSYWDGNACVKCAVTHYQSRTGQRQCDACPAGRRSVQEGATNASMCLIPCPAGQTLNSNSECVTCARGFYKNTPGFGACSACRAGFTTATPGSQADTACYRRCEVGEELSGDSCVPCPVGQYQMTAGERECSSCLPGFSTHGTGRNASNACIRECPAGKQLNEDSCVDCPRGYYKEVGGLALCTKCPMGSITPGGGATAFSACNQGDCQAGSFITGSTCTLCPLGQYQPNKWATECEDCPMNHLTSQTGSTNLAQCQFSCPAGETPSGNSCIKCARGTFKLAAGNDACTTCPALYTTTGTGATGMSQCNVEKCLAGYYRATNNLCTQCPQGQFQALTEQTSCIPCPAGFTTILDQHGQNIATSQSSCLSTNICARDADNCHVNADCIPNGDQFSCRCKLGFSGDGVFACSHLCDDPGYCSNNGICQRVSTTLGAHCLCNENYSGDRCETKAEETNNLAVIIGASVGGFIFLLLLILLIFVLVWLCCGQNVMCCQPQKEETTVTTVRSQAPPKIVTVPAIQPVTTYHTINGAAQQSAVFAPESQSNYDGSLLRYKVNPF